MDKIKRLILGVIPNYSCNFKCKYCYISQIDAWAEKGMELNYSPEYIAKCLSQKRLGGICMINLTGYGETLIQHCVVDIAKALLEEGHYVEIVTNGTVKKHIMEILQFPREYLSRLEFKISFHYEELINRGMLNKFFEIVNSIHSSGASFTLELMANDDIEDKIQEINEVCLQNVGAACIGTIGRNDERRDKGLLSKHSTDEFRKIWEPLNSTMLNFKLDVINVKRREFCYAGDWSLFVNIFSGETRLCYEIPDNQNIYDNPDEPIKFRAIGRHCRLPYCMNAHAHMAWGIIPEVQAPTYYDMRDRKCKNGEHWINNKCRPFFQSKLNETNEEYNVMKKVKNDISWPFFLIHSFCRNLSKNMMKLQKYVKRI